MSTVPSNRDGSPAYPLVKATDMHPDLVAALQAGEGVQSAVWACRVCGTPTKFVVVVPYDGAWRHAVEPLCDGHYPEHLPRLSTNGWPGPATPTLGARRRRAEARIQEALLNVERAARELDALFGGSPEQWTLDDVPVTDEASAALLSLHDYLNDVSVARKEADHA